MKTFARFVTTSYKFIILFWVALVIMMGFFAIRLPAILEGDGFNMKAEHQEVMDIAANQFDMPVETMYLVFDDVSDKEIKTTLEKIQKLGVINKIDSPLQDDSLYKDGFSYALLHVKDDTLNMSDVVTDIRHVLPEDSGITLTGKSAITKDINSASQRDLMIAEAIGLPIALLVLLAAFGSIVASIIPIIIGIVAVIVSFGIMTFIGENIDLSVFVLNIIPMLGLALSIDFALLIINRYREERVKTDIKTAVETTLQTAGRSVLFSAFCVFIGLGAMLFIQIAIFQNIAVGGMIIVLLAVLCSISFLPALLIVIGSGIDKWQVFKTRKNGADRWRSFANVVMKRPIIITLFAFVVLIIALIPVKELDLTIPQIDSLPTSYDTRTAYEKMEKTFDLGDETTVLAIANRSGGWDSPEGFQEIEKLTRYFNGDELVKDVATIYTTTGIETAKEWEQLWASPLREDQLEGVWEGFIQGDQLLIPVTLDVNGGSKTAQNWVREINNNDLNTHFLVGGEPKFNQEIFDEISNKIGLVLSVIVTITFVVLMIAFRSILIPLKAILMNMLGLGATFGILVYIFQYGHFGLTPGTIALIIPVMVFSLVFGLSMDYEVFLISRMQEEYANTLDNDYATVEGLARTSKVITSAALIMIVLTGAFAFTDVMPVKQIGVGIAIAIAIDASLIRLLLVPSLMKLLGKWNWWLPFRKGEYAVGKTKH
jgi:RND superfamily putative drug exporter